MTPLRSPEDPPYRAPSIVLVAALLLTVGLAGCLGSGSEDGPGDLEGVQIFLAAFGDPDGAATANLSTASLTLENGTTMTGVPSDQPADLADLAENGQAVLGATVPGVNGTVSATELTFDAFTVGIVSSQDARLSIPASYDAGPGTQVIITLDLNLTRERGEPTFSNLVVEEDGVRVASITRTEVEATPPEQIEPLPKPTVRVSAAEEGSNDTAPSFQINTDLNFTLDIPPTNVSIRQIFWTMGDDSTKTGQAVEHAYRTPGLYRVGAIVEGERGQQARANATIDAYLVLEGEGNVGVGTGGLGQIQDRDVKNHTLDVPANFTSLTFRLEQGTSGGVEDAPANVHVEVYNPEGELLGQNTSTDRVKYVNLTGLMHSGEWTIRVKGDQGAAVGYNFSFETHHLGLCAEFGGLGEDCPDPAEPASG